MPKSNDDALRAILAELRKSHALQPTEAATASRRAKAAELVAHHRKEFVRLLESDLGGVRLTERFDDFLHGAALALQNASLVPGCEPWRAGEAEYLRLVDKYRRIGQAEDLTRFRDMLGHLAIVSALDLERGGSGDVIGPMFMENGAACRSLGQFFSAADVCRLTAKLMMDRERIRADIARRGFVTLHEPAAGAGAMVLALAAELRDMGFNPYRQLYVSAWELEEHTAEACFIQLHLAGIPAVITHGNTLTLQTRRFWNTRALFQLQARYPDLRPDVQTAA